MSVLGYGDGSILVDNTLGCDAVAVSLSSTEVAQLQVALMRHLSTVQQVRSVVVSDAPESIHAMSPLVRRFPLVAWVLRNLPGGVR